MAAGQSGLVAGRHQAGAEAATVPSAVTLGRILVQAVCVAASDGPVLHRKDRLGRGIG